MTTIGRMALASALTMTVSAGLLAQGSRAAVRDAEAFRAQLLRAITADNRRAVAALFQYPLRVAAPLPHPIAVANRAALLQMYSLFFTPEMRCAIEESRVPQPGAPPPTYPLLAGDGVVTLAGGRIIARRTPAGFRITNLTILGAPASGAGRSTNVVFRWGSGDAQYAGRLAGDDVDTYVVSARQGNLLQARLERFPGRTLVIRVTDQSTGQTVKGGASEFVRSWAATVPSSGTYKVEIVRRAGYCDPTVTYLLTVAVRP